MKNIKESFVILIMIIGFSAFGLGNKGYLEQTTVRRNSQEENYKLYKKATDSLDFRTIDQYFVNPPNAYRVIQYSRHVGEILPVAKMRKFGIGGVMLFMQKDGYLRTEAAWENVNTNIHLIKDAGMQVWMADDNGYPSGMAGGLVVKANPDFEARCLIHLVREGKGLQEMCIDLPQEAEAFISAMIYPLKDGQLVFKTGQSLPVEAGHIKTIGLEGAWVLYAFARRINNKGTQAMQTASGFNTNGRYPNLLNKASMDKFLDLTHAEYARRLGPLLGKIDVFYSNEPNLMSLWFDSGSRPGGTVFIPWDTDLPQHFAEQHGYDLFPVLPALFNGESDEAKLTRRHFYQTVASVLAENYSGRIARWAKANHIQSAGHPLLEESIVQHVIGCGDLFRFSGEMQIPSCDIGIPDTEDGWTYWMPKFFSSIAELCGRKTVSALLDPMINREIPNLEPSSEDMRRTVNMAFLCGINQISTYTFWQKYQPNVYQAFNEYVGRVCLVMRGAHNAGTVAMYYPIETFQSNFVPSPSTWDRKAWPANWEHLGVLYQTYDEIMRLLITHNYNFNWVNGESVRDAGIKDSCLVIGKQKYRSIIMPQVELLPLAVVRKLEEFQKIGGKVLWINSLPHLGDTTEEHSMVREFASSYKVTTTSEVADQLGTTVPEGFRLRIKNMEKNFFIGRFTRAGRLINYVVNNSAEKIAPDFLLEGKKFGSIQVYNPEDGSITQHKMPCAISIKPYSSLFLVEYP